MAKPKDINILLAKTPFLTSYMRVGKHTHYKFYKAFDWPNPNQKPDFNEIFGTTIVGHTNARNFALGLVLGYAQRKLIIRKPVLEDAA